MRAANFLPRLFMSLSILCHAEGYCESGEHSVHDTVISCKGFDLECYKIILGKHRFRGDRDDILDESYDFERMSLDSPSNGPYSGQWSETDDIYGSFINVETTTKDTSLPENPEGLRNPSVLLGPWVEVPDIRETNAQFKGENGSIVSAQIGTTANLPCAIHNRSERETVSWIRLRDHHIITVGRQTYSSDDRFSVTYNRHKDEWTLHVRYAHTRDAGQYICQLSTHPPMVYVTSLVITEASATIVGGPERYVHEGSKVYLNCTLHKHTVAPDYIFWYHNHTMINFDTKRKVFVENMHDGSVLTLQKVGRTDSGNYTCAAANASPASIMLHITLSDAPAAMQVSNSVECQPMSLVYQILFVISFLNL